MEQDCNCFHTGQCAAISWQQLSLITYRKYDQIDSTEMKVTVFPPCESEVSVSPTKTSSDLYTVTQICLKRPQNACLYYHKQILTQSNLPATMNVL